MLLPPSAHFRLDPVVNSPFRASILARWVALNFEPRACREHLEEEMRKRPAMEEFLDPAAIENGGLIARSSLLLPGPPTRWRWGFGSKASGSLLDEVDAEDVETVALLQRVLSTERSPGRLRELCLHLLGGDQEQLDSFLARSDRDVEPAAWPPVVGPGIYRRGHASLLIASGTTQLLLDPRSMVNDWTTNGARYPRDASPLRVDGIVITHGHDDHWHLPSILSHGTKKTPVLVPRVPRTNLLSAVDMAAALAQVRQNVHTPDWWTTVRLGDIEIDVLPFYGEQPSVDEPPSVPELRMWGNCYRFNCPEFSALVLVDAGRDHLGSCLDVARRSRAERGPVDVVLSCAHEFPEMINLGLWDYALTFPFERLRAEHLERRTRRPRSMTLGPPGILDVCEAAEARHYLPYAHGFHGIGVDPTSAEGGEPESVVQRQIQELAAGRGVTTRFPDWQPGDVATFERGELTVHKAGAAP